MKNIILIFLLAISCSTFSQTIRRCNNNPGVTGVNVYTTLQAAHDASVAGDIIHVEPSTTDYGSLNGIKRITIIGNGYFITENRSTNTPQDQKNSIVSSITLNSGASNTKIVGITIPTNSKITVNVENVQIERCQLSLIYLGSVAAPTGNLYTNAGDNILIRGCFFTPSTTLSGNGLKIQGSDVPNGIVGGNPVFRKINNATIINNIHTTGYRLVGNIQNSLIKNNTVSEGLSAISNASSEFKIDACTFNDNIVIGGNNGSVINTNNISCIYSNNVQLCSACTNNYFPTGNGNQNNIAPNTYFTASTSGAIDVDYKAIQLINSPGLTAGSGGGQVGAFGGTTPYILSGLAPYPIITIFTTSIVGNPTTPLSVNVTVRGNN